MARFTPADDADKEILKARALKQKPNVKLVVATARGWEVPHNNGTMEILVSFKGLDELLGDLSSDQDKEADPVVIEAIEEIQETKQEEQTADEAVPAKKKGGRPKKVETATEETTEATE